MNKENKTLTPEYFEKVYAAKDDPWDFQTSEYEAAKYEATLDALPRKKYKNAFEIGCSIGILTEKLAEKCEELLAVDVSEKAIEQAKERCCDWSNVRIQKMQFPDEFPADKFDLIIISEVGYYLSPTEWENATAKVFAHLTEKGQVMLVHWTPFVHDYPQTGDEVHDCFAKFAENKMRKLSEKKTDTYRLDVWEKI